MVTATKKAPERKKKTRISFKWYTRQFIG